MGIAASLLTAACSSAGPQKKTTFTTASTSTGRTNASVCGSPASGSTTLTPTIDGHLRSVIVHVPRSYTGAIDVPLVLNLHGSGATAQDQENFAGMDSTADSQGFIVAYPQALIPDGVGFDWNVPGEPLVGGGVVPAGTANDVLFLTQLVGVLENRYCIDSARVYATGFSGGARTASQLACDASNVFAAVAPVSGLRHPDPCPTARPVPVVAFHGTVDPVDPYNGNGEPYWTYSVAQAAQDWAQQDNCSKTAATSQPGPNVTLSTYPGCPGGIDVELYSITGEGHEWPGGPPLPPTLTNILGPQSNAINANSMIWAFFESHPLL